MVDDGADHARLDSQLSDQEHARRRRAHGAPGLAYLGTRILLDRRAFQIAIMAQPLCGYVMDVLGLRIGLAIFATAWSLVNMAHGLAHSWQVLAGLRALLGFSEGSANPAGMKATAEWFPASERGFAGGLYNIGASVGSMIAPPLVVWAILSYNWQAAFLITGAMGLLWVVLWLFLYQSPESIPHCRTLRGNTSLPDRKSFYRATAIVLPL